MKKIVLIAHDRMKPKMAEFIKERADWLWGKELVATGRTAKHMEQARFKVPIHHLSQGRSGGYQEIIEMVQNGSVEMVFFFRDPSLRASDHPDIEALVAMVLEQDIPMASNPASAEWLILGQIKMKSSRKN